MTKRKRRTKPWGRKAIRHGGRSPRNPSIYRHGHADLPGSSHEPHVPIDLSSAEASLNASGLGALFAVFAPRIRAMAMGGRRGA